MTQKVPGSCLARGLGCCSTDVCCMWCVNICASVSEQPEYPDARHLVYMLHIIFWAVGQKQKMNMSHLHWVHSESPIMTYAPAPCKTMPALAPEHLRSPEAPSCDSTILHTTNWLRSPSQLPLLVGRGGNRQLGSGKVSIHLWLGGTGGSGSPASPRSTHPLTQSSQLWVNWFQASPHHFLPSHLMPDITQGQKSLGTMKLIGTMSTMAWHIAGTLTQITNMIETGPSRNEFIHDCESGGGSWGVTCKGIWFRDA